MKTNLTKTLIAAVVLVAAPAFAHEETVKPGAACSRHHVAANASYDKGMALLDQATKANAGQKDQLLAQARQELTTAKGHMDQCAKECGTMNPDQMHGAAGGHGAHGGHEHGAAQGGHSGHGHQHGAAGTATGTQAAMETDPVCGMKVSRNSEWKSVYAGKAYYFCNQEDKAAFDKNPESFLKKKS
ncbi:MAG TPA: YHS domain-containing protein [Thermoanaerobaculia bacterium]|nr:YHS domain-containing protein [Thermoanaerobaculia bacterium]